MWHFKTKVLDLGEERRLQIQCWREKLFCSTSSTSGWFAISHFDCLTPDQLRFTILVCVHSFHLVFCDFPFCSCPAFSNSSTLPEMLASRSSGCSLGLYSRVSAPLGGHFAEVLRDLCCLVLGSVSSLRSASPFFFTLCRILGKCWKLGVRRLHAERWEF